MFGRLAFNIDKALCFVKEIVPCLRVSKLWIVNANARSASWSTHVPQKGSKDDAKAARSFKKKLEE